MTWSIRLSDLYLIKKEKLARTLLFIGMLLAFLGSLNPWFLWPLGKLYIIPAAMLVGTAILVARSMSENKFFTRKDALIPLIVLVAFMIYERMSTNANINGYIIQFFRLVVFYALFTMDFAYLRRMTDFICKVMGGLLAISIVGHFLYILGFPLPGRDVEFDEFYSFTNHYLFLLDDRNLFLIFPRFNSYFLEPSHIGQACAFLLLTQRGMWKRWYNMVLVATVLLSFSLAAYAYLLAVLFFNQWISRKNVIGKVLIAIAAIAIATVVAFNYNKGENLVHDLILLRLEVNDGELVGDNRVTDDFLSEYESFVESSDIVFGRNFEIIEFGNAGYRVFFYENGIVGVFLIFLLYFTSIMYATNRRAIIAVMTILLLYFWATAFMMWECVFFPLYAAAYLATEPADTSEVVEVLEPVEASETVVEVGLSNSDS